MTDREVFRDNLNYYLNKYGKLQKDLAEYVGAKTTTVSGWTRGVSYPRADAMEKIALFFGIPTSQLIGDREDIVITDSDDIPQTIEAKILSKGIDKLPKEQREQALAMFKVMFAPQYADLFTKGEDDDT